MAYRTWLEIQRRSGIDRREIAASALVGEAEGACPGCGAVPFLVQGQGIAPDPAEDAPEGQLRANGKCAACSDSIGYIYALPSTLFGAAEDVATLAHARCRVY